jgi:hypothetical protein
LDKGLGGLHNRNEIYGDGNLDLADIRTTAAHFVANRHIDSVVSIPENKRRDILTTDIKKRRKKTKCRINLNVELH